MKITALIKSFRARLLLLLALMLGITLGVQYYVNSRSVRNNAHVIMEQEQAIMTGIALGIQSLQSREYLDKIVASVQTPLVNDQTGRVKNILLIDDSGNVLDSIIPEYNPVNRDDGTVQYFQFRDLPLPPLRSAVQLVDEEELRRLRTQHSELMRLRGEVTQLRRQLTERPIVAPAAAAAKSVAPPQDPGEAEREQLKQVSIARMIVEAHGGTIRLTSAPGVGTRADIHLPRQGPRPEPTS